MSKDKKCVLRRRNYSISIILIEDEVIRNTVIDRFIENSNNLECDTKYDLAGELLKSFTNTDMNKYQILINIASGWNAPLKYLIGSSSVFKINMCHFMDTTDSEYSKHPYEEYDEFEIVMRNIRKALMYGKYSMTFLTRIKRISNGEYITPFGTTYRKEISAEYFPNDWFMKNFAVNDLIHVGKILNIPIHAFFIPDENVFSTYMENIVPQSYYREKYMDVIVGKSSMDAKIRRREKALEVEPDFYELGSSPRSMPIYDVRIRDTIIKNSYTLMASTDLTRADLARSLGLSHFIVSSIIEGRNTHVEYYFQFCDYFGVFFGDFINPDVTTLCKYDGKNTDIDLRTILLNACSKAHLDINSLNPERIGDEKFYKLKNSLLNLYRAVNRSTQNSTHGRNNGYRNRISSKYRTLFNTLLDYCELFHTDLVSLICDNVTVTREIAPKKIHIVNKFRTVSTKDPDMVFIYDTYMSLTQDQKDTVMQLLKILREKNSEEKSQTN